MSAQPATTRSSAPASGRTIPVGTLDLFGTVRRARDPYRAALRAAHRLARHPEERRLARVVCQHLRELLDQAG